MTKHTAGPWYVVEDVDRFEIDANRRSVATTTDNRTDDLANARLIAAAPEMYDALVDILAQIDALDAYSCADVHDAMRAALAKAEGR